MERFSNAGNFSSREHISNSFAMATIGTRGAYEVMPVVHPISGSISFPPSPSFFEMTKLARILVILRTGIFSEVYSYQYAALDEPSAHR